MALSDKQHVRDCHSSLKYNNSNVIMLLVYFSAHDIHHIQYFEGIKDSVAF